jgi:hypothetical protein
VGVVTIGFGLGGNGQLRYLRRRFIPMDYFAGSSNVEGQRMVVLEVVKLRVMAIASAGTVEALKADIEARGLVDRVEAYRAVLSVNGV